MQIQVIAIGETHDPDFLTFLKNLGNIEFQHKVMEPATVAGPANVVSFPEGPAPVIDDTEKLEAYKAEVVQALENDAKTAKTAKTKKDKVVSITPKVPVSEAPVTVEEPELDDVGPAPAEDRVVTEVDLRMKAKALIDQGKRNDIVAALAAFKGGAFPKISDIKEPADRAEFMVMLEGC